MTDFISEMSLLEDANNQEAMQLQALIMEYLEAKLDNNEC